MVSLGARSKRGHQAGHRRTWAALRASCPCKHCTTHASSTALVSCHHVAAGRERESERREGE